MSLDLRVPAFGTPRDQLYRAALDMAAWADERGVSAISLSEHHGSDDGCLPAALTMAAAVAARTERCFITINALPLTMHDPVTVASSWRSCRRSPAGASWSRWCPGTCAASSRCSASTPGHGAGSSRSGSRCCCVPSTARSSRRGRTVRVTPTPTARPVVLVGGTTPAAARRAARLGDGFLPTTADPALVETYHRACV